MLLFVLILYGLIGFILASFIHETGHLLIALFYKWKFRLLIVGPLCWERTDSTQPIKFRFEFNPLYWGGVSSAMPQDSQLVNPTIWRKILISGPLLSIIVSILLIPVLFLTRSYFVLLLIAESFGMGVICILPFPLRTGITYSDGYRYWRLSRNGVEKVEEEALLNLSLLDLLYPSRPRLEEVKAMLSSLLESKDYTYRYFANYQLYAISEQENNTLERKHYLDELIHIESKTPKTIRKLYKIP